LRILPLGLVFEDKSAPDTVAGAHIGEPIEMDSWQGSNPAELTAEIADRLRGVSQNAELPAVQDPVKPGNTKFVRELLISLAAKWGRVTHHIPVRIARRLAVKRSSHADEAAMLTMLFGIGLVLLTYIAHFTIVGLLAHSFLAACFYMIALVSGAYWAAFERHPRRQ
jgi:hypothetical protein